MKSTAPFPFVDAVWAPVIAFFAANAIARLMFSEHSDLMMVPDIGYMVQIRQIYATTNVVLAFSTCSVLGFFGAYFTLKRADRRGDSRLRALLLASAILTFVLLLPDLVIPAVIE